MRQPELFTRRGLALRAREGRARPTRTAETRAALTEEAIAALRRSVRARRGQAGLRERFREMIARLRS